MAETIYARRTKELKQRLTKTKDPDFMQQFNTLVELLGLRYRSPKSANGRMATEAAWLNGDRPTERKKRKCALTSTGLLMEGLAALHP